MSIDALQSIFSSALVLGSLYALMAAGLALTWTTLGIFNFAHGALMMIGAYIAWQIGTYAGLGLGLAAGMAIGVAALVGLGIVMERLVVRPFLRSPQVVLITVITTLAAMIFLQNSALLSWGPRMKQIPPLLPGGVEILGMSFSAHELLIIVTAPLLLGGLWLFLTRTRLGTAIRAVAQNPESASLMGLDVSRMYSLAFAISAGLAGFAGILLGSLRFITPTMGLDPLIKAIIVVIFGGLGSLGGTVGAAYIIGIFESISLYYVGLYWTPALLFLIIIIVLVVRPNGLFGKE